MIQLNDFSIIFDMDGVLVQTVQHHKQAWKLFCEKYDFTLTENEMQEKIYGSSTKSIIENLFGDAASEEEKKKYALEKGALYRQCCQEDVKIVEGLIPFLEKLKEHNLKLAVGTAASTPNVDFVMKKIGIRPYFLTIVDSFQVEKSKPNPEVFLTAAKRIEQNVERCVVFEDSLAGIEAARNAGMKVIALATTHSKEELTHADLVIDNFNEITIEEINALFSEN